MRDVKRIYEVMALITMIWEKQPDTRFTQLIHNLQWQFSEERVCRTDEVWEKDEYKGIVTYRKKEILDLYDLEDEVFIDFLKEKLDEYNKL